MTHEPQNQLAHLVRRYASDPAASRQMQKLPSFSLPQGSSEMFQGLLERLETMERRQAARAV